LLPCGCRLANAHAAEIKKLGVRGTLANGVAKVESVKAAASPPVWFVFSGAAARAGAWALLLRHAAGRTSAGVGTTLFL